MALIKCSECGSEVSDKAAACPKCGNPINEIEPPREATTKTTSSGALAKFIGFMMIVIGMFMAIAGAYGSLGGVLIFIGIVLFIMGRFKDG